MSSRCRTPLLGATSKLNDLNPELYLWHVLERIGDHPINRTHQLLHSCLGTWPRNFQPILTELSEVSRSAQAIAAVPQLAMP
jgi:hypothetical protein